MTRDQAIARIRESVPSTNKISRSLHNQSASHEDVMLIVEALGLIEFERESIRIETAAIEAITKVGARRIMANVEQTAKDIVIAIERAGFQIVRKP